MARGGFLDAAYEILREEGSPMHGMEIVRIGKERGMFTSDARDEYSLVRTLSSEVKRSSNRRGFTALGNSYFGLREWDGSSQQPVTQAAGPRRERPTRSAPVQSAGVSLEMLDATRQSMSADQFRQIWGTLYDQLLAEERAKAITSLNDKELASRARKPLREIQYFLQGRGNYTPQSDEICDWIHLCYALELYREAAALWQYVHLDEVNPWQLDRTRRIVAVCRTRV